MNKLTSTQLISLQDEHMASELEIGLSDLESMEISIKDLESQKLRESTYSIDLEAIDCFSSDKEKT